jgi:hypothetical protein
MAGTLTMESWPTTTGFSGASYFDNFLEGFQYGSPAEDGVVPQRDNDILGAYTGQFRVFGDSTGMQVKIYAGRAVAKGVFAKIPAASLTAGTHYILDVTAAHATLQRIDRVIVRFDLTTGSATLRMLNGTPAAAGSAVPAALTNTATNRDVQLAIVIVDAAATTIAPADVVDKRRFAKTTDALARALAAQNAFYNGGMGIWNDGTLLGPAASLTYGAEGYMWIQAGAGAVNLIKAADAPTVDESVGFESSSFHVDVTTADASLAATDRYNVQARIEGRRFRHYAHREFTVGFWVKAPRVGVHCVAFVNSGSDRSFVAQYFVEAADTWEYHWVHVETQGTGGTWDYDTGLGIVVRWAMAAGSTFQTATPDTWVTGNFDAATRQVNSVESTSYNFKVTMPRMTLGPIDLPFAPHNDEELLANRYYRVFGGITSEIVGRGYAGSTTVARVGTVLSPPMRTVPTIAVTAAGDWSVQITGSIIACTAVTISGTSSTQVAEWDATVAAGLTAGDGCRFIATAASTSTPRLKLSARL